MGLSAPFQIGIPQPSGDGHLPPCRIAAKQGILARHGPQAGLVEFPGGTGEVVQPFTCRDLAGNLCTLRLLECLLHLVNHGTYHRGQITSKLRQLGAQPVSTDMNRFFQDRAAAG